MEAWKSSGANLSASVTDSNEDGLATSVPKGTGLHQSGFPRFFGIEYLQSKDHTGSALQCRWGAALLPLAESPLE
jgi:hypothetical protein